MCRLWVPLASGGRHHATSVEPHTYLVFKRTGFIVGLPDEPGVAVEASQPRPRMLMRRADADGLGLTPSDFADGIAICHSDGASAAEAAWRCEPVQLLIGGDERRPLHDYQLGRAPHVEPSLRTAGADVATWPPPPRWRRALVHLEADGDHSEFLGAVAALAREHVWSVIVAAGGEVPESAAHAAEMRASISGMLERAARRFSGVAAHTAYHLTGDRVGGLMRMVAEERAELVVVAADRRTLRMRLRDDAVVGALLRHGEVPFVIVPTSPGRGSPAPAGASGAGAPARERIPLVRVPLPTAKDTQQWVSELHERLRAHMLAHARLLHEATIDLELEWHADAAATVRSLGGLRPQALIDGIAEAAYWPGSPGDHVRSIYCAPAGLPSTGEQWLSIRVSLVPAGVSRLAA